MRIPVVPGRKKGEIPHNEDFTNGVIVNTVRTNAGPSDAVLNSGITGKPASSPSLAKMPHV